MLKRELKFSAYLLPVIMMSFVHLARGDDALQIQNVPVTTEAVPAVAPAQMPVKKHRIDTESDIISTTFESKPMALLNVQGSSLAVAEAGPAPASIQAAASASAPLNISVVSAAKDSTGALNVKLSNGQVINLAGIDPAKIAIQANAVAESKSEELPGSLDYSQASAAIKGLTIKREGTHAILDGWVPNKCDGEYSVVNTDEPSVLSTKRTDGVTYIGFNIVNKNGRFLSCMNDPRNNCDLDSTPCHHLSEGQTPLILDGKEHYALEYLNNHRTTGITPVNMTGAVTIRSLEEVQNEKLTAQNKVAQKIEDDNFKALGNCVKKADDLEALRALVDVKLNDDGHKQTIIDKIMAEEKTREKAEVTKLENKIKDLRKKADGSKTKLEDIEGDDGLNAQVYELASQLDVMKGAEPAQITEKEYTKQQDILAGVVQKLIELRVSDDPNAESFEDAKAMLDQALSGTSSAKDEESDSDGTGLHPSKKALKELEAIYPILRRAKVSNQYMACMEDQYQLGGKKPTSAARDCKEAQKEFASETKALEKEYKGCLDKNGEDSKKRQNDKDFAAQCKEVEDEEVALQEVPSVDNAAISAEYQAAVKKANGGKSATGLGQNQLGTQNGLFAGAPQTPTFATGGIPTVYGTPGSLGVNQYAYAPGATMMPGLSYNAMNSPVSGAFNGYRGF